jgi:hypothetical protein
MFLKPAKQWVTLGIPFIGLKVSMKMEEMRLIEISRKKPNEKNRVATYIEEAVLISH